MGTVSHAKERETIERMVVEKGEKVGKTFIATFSFKDVLDRLGMPNTEKNHNYIRYVIRYWYPASVFGPGQGDNGGVVRVKIRGI